LVCFVGFSASLVIALIAVAMTGQLDLVSALYGSFDLGRGAL
jgi:hypothetical protein